MHGGHMLRIFWLFGRFVLCARWKKRVTRWRAFRKVCLAYAYRGSKVLKDAEA